MGASAEEPERNTSLGIFYDEILRKEVENKCGQLGADWEYASMFAQVDESILRKARRLAPPFLFVLVRVHSPLCIWLTGNLMKRIRSLFMCSPRAVLEVVVGFQAQQQSWQQPLA